MSRGIGCLEELVVSNGIGFRTELVVARDCDCFLEETRWLSHENVVARDGCRTELVVARVGCRTRWLSHAMVVARNWLSHAMSLFSGV